MKIDKMLKSFTYAGNGFFSLLRSENNFKFHFLAATLVICAGFWYNLESGEWALLIIQIAFVFASEAFNTAIEKLADFIQPNPEPKIGIIKDIAAAGVLVAAVCAVIVGILIFYPKVF